MIKSELLVKLNDNTLNYYEKSKIYEEYNIKYLDGIGEAAYYTKEVVVKHMIDNLPNINKSEITIMEPSVGIGNFIPHIIKKYIKHKKIILILNDINKFSLECLEIILNNFLIENNITNVNIIYTNTDFLKNDFKEYNIDLIIGNPPYFTIKNKEYLKYCKIKFNDTTNNIFAFFILHSLNISDKVSFIVPKGLLFAANYKNVRKKIYNNITNIIDYYKDAFNVNLETISLIYDKKQRKNKVKIENYNEKKIIIQENKYIFNKNFPIWIIYRNKKFDDILKKIILNSFDVFRDRQLTNSYLNKDFGMKVLRSRNIQKEIISIQGYDRFIDIEKFNLNELVIYKKIINNSNIIIVPNLTPKPRFLKLPKNTIVNGSLALFIPREKIIVKQKDLDFLNSQEFIEYFDIVRNKSILSINLDNYIGYFIGILK